MNFNVNTIMKALFPKMRETASTPFSGVAKKTTYKDKKFRNPTKKGGTHKVGKHFLGRNILSVTGAKYRHLHMSNPSKAAKERANLEKRKWISA